MDLLIERTVREAYGRLVAILAARTRDIMAAEDALQDALVAALDQWPRDGTPRDPEAWLMTVAKRRLLDGHRRHALTQEIVANWPAASASQEHTLSTPFSDDRLELMLLCSHRAIDRAMHAPLMLQTVLGLNAERIAAAFLVSPSTMSQRLVRAKQKVRDAGIRFELPDPSVLEARISSLLDAIYAAYGTAWEDLAAAGPGRYLHQEATLLCKAVLQRLPTHAEALGLLALMRYTEARDHARRDADGAYVPLSEQDVQRWDRDILMEAEAT
ncbi:MAG: RNA polymerase sigma factor, partial [Flavobacteriales bacterium]